MINSILIYFFGFYLVTFSLVGEWLEASMVRHVLIQIPLLILLGYLFGSQYLKNNRILLLINEKGLAGILLCIFIGSYWMLPRALDASLANPMLAVAKYFSLPFLVGIPLAISWGKLHSIARAVIKIEFLTMLFRLGWLYLVSPNRLCNFYQLNDQALVGKYFLIIAVVISGYFIWKIFSLDYSESKTDREIST
ncbi:MAG: hypothetical protein AB8D52_10950 [Gammaproteobacteria bacterium]